MSKVVAAAAVAAALTWGCNPSSGVSRLAEVCQETTTMSPDLCQCVAEQAGSELSADARALLLALMEKRTEEAAQIRNRLSLEDATKAGTFLVRAPATCAIRLRTPSRTERSP